ncbi:hypothetical protein LOD99_14767 [Oopsacas minuta]|uniref:Uncharacterized protein n=1 Tax=Oopsacas minuta TaxID=111878 RepID=A0AAV7KCB1_9METZ|nr:hypothetical protein LOD99_14767 [Oopsacas minuta]
MFKTFQERIGMMKSLKKPTLMTEFSSNYIYDKSKPPASPIINTHKTYERAMKEKELLAFEQQKHERERKELLSKWTNDRESKCRERTMLRKQKQMDGEVSIANQVLIRDRKERLRKLFEEEGKHIQKELSSMGIELYTERI